MKPKSECVDVADVVRAAVERARKAFPAGASSPACARDLPFVRGDRRPDRTGAVQPARQRAEIRRRRPGRDPRAAAKAAKWSISVTDEGPGIKPADLERIFEKFYQGGRGDGRKTGVGLGLSIAKGLIEAMGGRIWAESPAARRRGTRLADRLPPPSAETRRPP